MISLFRARMLWLLEEGSHGHDLSFEVQPLRLTSIATCQAFMYAAYQFPGHAEHYLLPTRHLALLQDCCSGLHEKAGFTGGDP